MTLCALYRDAAAFIDALGTIHFWELRVRRFYHCHYAKVLWLGWEPCSIFGVASPKYSWRTTEVKLKVWWWEEMIRLLLPGWKWKSESSGHQRYTKGNELGLGIGPWGLQIKPAPDTASKISAVWRTYCSCMWDPMLCFSEIIQIPCVCELSKSKPKIAYMANI